MADNIELIVLIQEHVIIARKLAAVIGDRETARRLHELADEIEQRARFIDAMD
jgi:hypothetical protein